jgi:hypothetical protein
MKATCHCNAITLDLPAPITPINECLCTVCIRYGATWLYYPLADVKITKQDGLTTKTYAHGAKKIDFHFCERCYGLMYWYPRDDNEDMGVNSRMVADRAGLEGVEVEHVDPDA